MGKASRGLTEKVREKRGGMPRKAAILFAVVASIAFLLAPVANIRAETDPYNLFAKNFTFSRFGIFDAYEITNLSRFDYDPWKTTTEIDYRFTENFVLESALRSPYADAFVYDHFGEFDAENQDLSVSLYGAYFLENFYFDAAGIYGSGNYYEQMLSAEHYLRSAFPRLMTMAAREWKQEPEDDFYSFSVGTGYTFNRNSFSFGPYLRANYLKSEIDGFTDKLKISGTENSNRLAMHLADGDIESFTTSLGGQAAYVFSTNLGLLTPYMRLEWEHEYENDSGAVNGRFINSLSGVTDVEENDVILITTDKTDRDYFNFGLGLTMVFPNGFMAFMDYETILGLENIDSHQFAAGLRFEY